jgi:hypothetical protein
MMQSNEYKANKQIGCFDYNNNSSSSSSSSSINDYYDGNYDGSTASKSIMKALRM